MIQFFKIDEELFLTTISYVLATVVLIIGLIVINLSFTIIHLSEELSSSEIIAKIRGHNLLKNLKYFFTNFIQFLKENLEIGFRTEKYPTLFFIIILIFLPFSKGNFILNNYYGIFKVYDSEEHGGNESWAGSIENQNYIIHKSNVDEIDFRINNMEENFEENEPYFEVKKRGYLFIQAGLIDGYKTYYDEYEGFLSYIECLLFSLLEKFINSIIYFFIPFVVTILLYHYKLEYKR
jgi:hypothetical protein